MLVVFWCVYCFIPVLIGSKLQVEKLRIRNKLKFSILINKGNAVKQQELDVLSPWTYNKTDVYGMTWIKLLKIKNFIILK